MINIKRKSFLAIIYTYFLLIALKWWILGFFFEEIGAYLVSGQIGSIIGDLSQNRRF